MATPRSFLDLPYSVRLQVYEYSGLVQHCAIDLGPGIKNQPLHEIGCTLRRRQSFHLLQLRLAGASRGYTTGCDRNISINLLLVSKAVSDEAHTILFGRNTFLVQADSGEGLRVLQAMRPTSLAAIKCLMLRLSPYPCKCGEEHIPLIHDHEEFNYNDTAHALNATSPAGQAQLRRWRAVCRSLSSGAPGQLRLCLIWDVLDLNTANEIIAPLYELPHLKECTLRFKQTKNSGLAQLASTTSRQLTEVSPSSFHFQKLPAELRVKILQYTHLTPRGKFQSRDNVFSIQEKKWFRNTLSGGRTYLGKPGNCCWSCVPVRHLNCACPHQRTSYSSTCVCRQIPLALFTVNKQMYREASAVFFSNATFAFQRRSPEDAIDFLKGLPRSALHSIRHLRFHSIDVGKESLLEEDYDKKWLATVAFIKDSLDISKVTIEVLQGGDTFAGTRVYHENRHLQNPNAVFEVYSSIIGPLCTITNSKPIAIANNQFMNLDPQREETMARREENSESTAVSISSVEYSDGHLKVPLWWYQRFTGKLEPGCLN